VLIVAAILKIVKLAILLKDVPIAYGMNVVAGLIYMNRENKSQVTFSSQAGRYFNYDRF
jgi:hypothetical protein